LVNNQGYAVQGKQATAEGVIAEDAVVGKLVLAVDTRVEPKATTAVTITGNLDAETSMQGTLTRTKSFLATASQDEDISGLFANGAAETFLNLISGLDSITVGDQVSTKNFSYGVDFTTLADLATAVDNEFNARFTTVFNDPADGGNGQITFTSVAPEVRMVIRSDTNSALDAAFATVHESVLITAGFGAGQSVNSDEFAHRAGRTDPVINLRNAQGDTLGLQIGDDLTLLSASIGGSLLPATSLFADIDETSTFEQFRLNLATALYGTIPQPEEKVEIEEDGRIRIEGGLGIARSVTSLKIVSGADPNTDTRASFGSSFTFFEEQAASDVTHTMTTTTYDNIGQAHTLQVEFTRTRESGKWNWRAFLTGKETVRSGATGIIQFNRDGSLNSLQYDAGATAFSFDPGNDSALVSVELLVGSEGLFDGVTFFASPSTAAVVDQDGSALGVMESVSIDEAGMVFANFDNGIRKVKAQISVAQFNNPTGLIKAQDSLFINSVNSGNPIVADAAKVLSKIVSKKLERSNVDIAEQFTLMITAQRGLQANSRVITTSDDVLTELINLKR
jgi:flagellar hook protein FlgE